MTRVEPVVTPARMVLLAALTLLGCSDTVRGADASTDVPRATDGAPRDRAPTTGDSDHDGVCDDTEAKVRTDPHQADTDGDGLSDAYELLIDTDPINPRDPNARDRVPVVEGEDLFATVEHFVPVGGTGAPVSAYWQDRTAGPDGRYASELVSFDIAAIDADPMGLVRAVDGPRFVGVTGRTTLHWRVTVRAMAADGGARVLGCRRAYEALVVAREDGGEPLSQRRLVIDVSPRVPAGTDAEFCSPASCF